MQEILVAARRPYASLLTRPNVAWAVGGAVTFIVTAVTLLALRELPSTSLGAVAQSWVSDLGFGLLVLGVPAAIISIVLLAHASFVRLMLARRIAPADAPVVAVAATYGLIAAVAVIADFPAWFPISAVVAGGVVAAGVRRTVNPPQMG